MAKKIDRNSAAHTGRMTPICNQCAARTSRLRHRSRTKKVAYIYGKSHRQAVKYVLSFRPKKVCDKNLDQVFV